MLLEYLLRPIEKRIFVFIYAKQGGRVVKSVKLLPIIGLVLLAITIAACSNSSSDSGTVSMSITDAKPLLPENVTNLFVEFSEIWVHKSGGDWQQLALAETPYTIDLLQFQDGSTTELVPPATLENGKYTQVRIVVDSATLRFDNDQTTDEPLEIPSDNLKTDKNFTIDVTDGTAMYIVIHLDLSMSVVETGTGTYQMKPVIHLFKDDLQGAIITGSIDNESFGDSGKATVTVLDSSREVYTKVEVEESADDDPTMFSIFWLEPNQTYYIQIDKNQDGTIDCNDYEETILSIEAEEEYFLNDGGLITLGNIEPCPVSG